MNQIALRERFLVLYPEQNRIANLQGCWNWHQTRFGQAQAEADAINAKISRVCKLHAVDPERMAVAGFSAGAGMAALLVLQGSTDSIVAPRNGILAAHSWASLEGAKAAVTRKVQRGTRYPLSVTDYRAQGRLVVTLCDISGLAHAWSGGAASQAFSDPKGPDASRMVWSFVAKQFAASAKTAGAAS